ncbi:hypothetical protein NDU88_003290 [Pleurodeles waltl]|uniref:Uncharacterized protein n=1 Tax=Pleurodeles waltl TaxID=8319 RepID=A0AAV7NG75_PLEWA|nr:hypothetical protein NDU88_003290 [Pleurodeles waltl]
MAWGKRGKITQHNKMDKYVIPVTMQGKPVYSFLDPMTDLAAATIEPNLKDIMVAIQVSKGTLKPKVDSFVMEMSFLRADINKTNDRLKDTDMKVKDIDAITTTLKHEVDHLQKDSALM